MKKNLTDLLYSEMAGSGESGVMDRVIILMERRAKGEKLTKKEESVLAEAEKGLADLLGDSRGGYCPDKAIIKGSDESLPLPFSSFAEGLAQLQRRIQRRGTRPQLRSAVETGAYRPDRGALGEVVNKVSAVRVAAIVKMAQDERAKLKKINRKKK